MSAFKHLKVTAATASNAVGMVKLDRPAKKNAWNQPMYLEISRALAESNANPHCKALVLTGEGSYYSSGNDLSNFSRPMHPKKMAAEARVFCQTFVDSFINFQKPLFVSVNGPAIGIAVTTMGLCDVRYACKDATFHTPFRQLGQAPEGCSSFVFPRLMGPEAAQKVLNDGVRFTAKEAFDWKFVDEVFETPELTLESTLIRANMLVDGQDRKPFDRMTLDKKYRDVLKSVNAKECAILEKAWVSKECFDALDTYLSSRKQTGPALVIRALNKTRFVWDR